MPNPPPGTPPNLWRLARIAAARCWRVTIERSPAGGTITATIDRPAVGRGLPGPRLTAEWTHRAGVDGRRPGWRYTAGTYRDGYGGKPVPTTQADLFALIATPPDRKDTRTP